MKRFISTNAAAVQLMKMAIARLTPDDLVSVAAYVSSRPLPSLVTLSTSTH
jgi:hypothetical protein